MIDKDWLEQAINDSAESAFEQKYEQLDPCLSGNNGARMAFQSLKNTKEFKDFKDNAIESLKKQTTQDILARLSGIKSLFDRSEQ